VRRIGAHVPNAHPLQEAASRQTDVIQLFLSNPQGWRPPEPRPDAAELAASTVDIYVHAPYLVNLVAENNRVRIPSRKILQETCDAAASIGARGVVVHGGHVTDGPLEDAWPRWRKALEQLDTTVPVLIENTASGDRAAARRVDDLARLWQEIGDLAPGLVLDTCHAWAGGEPLAELVERVMAATGRIDLIHANDSRDPFDSRRDRHANLGEGHIPPDQLAAVLRGCQAPIVIETPGDVDAHCTDLAWIHAQLE
jgi:deoxyribonuclease IV